ncbi:MAG TPA: phenylalanine--tRNA ligase beta subunit-related protein [Patescibacteria group bacterium]|nr:phenylalanine--tRNA ligase beta subunit-related protein [Patescibacteria group bacterium]
MNAFNFSISEEIKSLSIPVIGLHINGIGNAENAEFETYKNQEITKLQEIISVSQIEDDVILKGFRDLHEKVGRSNRKYIASPEALLNFIVSKGRLPKINPIVDMYNLISSQSRLALGAHDVIKIVGNVTLRLTKGNESFIPLGKTEPEIVQPGEYAYIDEGNNVICRLEVLQCNQTKITPETTDMFLIIQGNPNTDISYVRSTAARVGDLIQKYCGGIMEMMQPPKREVLA